MNLENREKRPQRVKRRGKKDQTNRIKESHQRSKLSKFRRLK